MDDDLVGNARGGERVWPKLELGLRKRNAVRPKRKMDRSTGAI